VEEYRTSNISAVYHSHFGLWKGNIFTPKYTLKYGIRVGRTVDYIKRVLGEPYKIESNKLYYSNRTRYDEMVFIFSYTEDNLISSISWEVQI
jgi:hypothetical protein